MGSKASVVLTDTGSHWITLRHNQKGDVQEKEEVFFYFKGTWRGGDVMYAMQADRYSAGMDRNHQTLTAWRVCTYSTGCRYVDENANGYRGGPLTDIANMRLADMARPIVEQWLSSEEYDRSATSAWAYAVLREIADNRSGDTDYLRAKIEIHGNRYPEITQQALVSVCNAKDEVRYAMARVKKSIEF